MATVKELIGALRNFDENQEVFVWDGDNNIPLDKHFLSLFDSDDIQNENNPLAINIECSNKKLKQVEPSLRQNDAKSATVVFERSVQVNLEDEEMLHSTEDEIIERALDIWNEDIDLGVILMQKDHIKDVTYE
ncbi:hypothetical protein KLEB273_gp173 [Bacillus phage vB_BauM_KLEB27-3]|nr:hypothetical protein KLEB273_gp173 [Bacillus phage vB_BauM_KLEB27-3]